MPRKGSGRFFNRVSMVAFEANRIWGWFFLLLFVYLSDVFVISMCCFAIMKITTKVASS